MTFKEFTNWCNERACDGMWGLNEAIACINAKMDIDKQWFFRREKYWQKNHAELIVNQIIIPTEEIIKSRG